jgi:molybdenum storage protein
MSHSDIVKLPTYFAEGIIPVMHGMPPYDYFAIKPPKGRIPIHRTDVGLVILADLIGSRRILFVKDEKGLYTEDPKKNPEAEFIPRIGARELLDRDQDDLVIERPCLEIIQNSEVIEEVQIINGMVPGNITKALAGAHVGTIIYKED